MSAPRRLTASFRKKSCARGLGAPWQWPPARRCHRLQYQPAAVRGGSRRARERGLATSDATSAPQRQRPGAGARCPRRTPPVAAHRTRAAGCRVSTGALARVVACTRRTCEGCALHPGATTPGTACACAKRLSMRAALEQRSVVQRRRACGGGAQALACGEGCIAARVAQRTRDANALTTVICASGRRAGARKGGRRNDNADVAWRRFSTRRTRQPRLPLSNAAASCLGAQQAQ